MQQIALELSAIVDRYRSLLEKIGEEEAGIKPAPAKWSKKEILGHLIDSAQNNIRRFIVARYEEAPTIVYNQDQWVAMNQYQSYHFSTLIQLWTLLNKQVETILSNSTADQFKRNCQTESLHSIEWLAIDYLKHLKHHLHQLLNLEPVAYP